jgi:hypothetical protein
MKRKGPVATQTHIESVGLALVADDDNTFRQLLARRGAALA